MNKGVAGRKYNISACTIRCFRKRIKEKFGREVFSTSESEMQASSHRKPKLPPVASGATPLNTLIARPSEYEQEFSPRSRSAEAVAHVRNKAIIDGGEPLSNQGSSRISMWRIP